MNKFTAGFLVGALGMLTFCYTTIEISAPYERALKKVMNGKIVTIDGQAYKFKATKVNIETKTIITEIK